MESLGFIFGIMGMSFGLVGLIFSVITMDKVNKLEKSIAQQSEHI